MTVRQYGRKVSLLVGNDQEALDLSDFRFRFHVCRGDYQTPNSLDCRIYNLAPATVAKIENEFSRVILQGGFEGNFGGLFDGTIKQPRKGRSSQTDTYIDITAADGDHAYNYSTLALSLAAGSTPTDSVQAMIQAMASSGISEGYLPELPGSGRVRGRVFYGMARDEMREFAQNCGCSWSIQNGKLTMIPLTAYIPGEVPIISNDTGLIGTPEQTHNGINFRVLLNPSIKIGQKIKLDNATINKLRYGLDVQSQARNEFLAQQIKTNDDGEYYVMVSDHYGDTHSNDFFTDAICLAVDATVPESMVGRAAIAPEAAAIKKN